MTTEQIKQQVRHTAKLVPESQRELFLSEIHSIIDSTVQMSAEQFISTLADDSCECDNCNRTRNYFSNPKKELLRYTNKLEAEIKKERERISMKKTQKEIAEFIIFSVLDLLGEKSDYEYTQALNVAVTSTVSTLRYIGYIDIDEAMEIAKHIAEIIQADGFSAETDSSYKMFRTNY